jgi:uncharacterized repeat protein (TIGR01451 family)
MNGTTRRSSYRSTAATRPSPPRSLSSSAERRRQAAADPRSGPERSPLDQGTRRLYDRVVRTIGGRLWLGVVLLLAALPAGARATVLGELNPSRTDPGFGGECVATDANYLQAGIAPGDPTYTVPVGGGVITSWGTKYGTEGATVGLEVWRPGLFEAEYQFVALDSQTIARNAAGISTFSSSIPVRAGDVLGIQQPVAHTLACAFAPSDHSVNSFVFGYFGSPAVGGTINFDETDTVFANLINLTATVRQSANLGLRQKATPSTVRVGDLVQLLFSVSNAGPAPSPTTLRDKLPAGLTAISAVAQNGNCKVGRAVTCQLSQLPGGTRSAVVIDAKAIKPGNYTNHASTAGLASNTDPNPANNTASAAVKVLSARAARDSTRDHARYLKTA